MPLDDFYYRTIHDHRRYSRCRCRAALRTIKLCAMFVRRQSMGHIKRGTTLLRTPKWRRGSKHFIKLKHNLSIVKNHLQPGSDIKPPRVTVDLIVQRSRVDCAIFGRAQLPQYQKQAHFMYIITADDLFVIIITIWCFKCWVGINKAIKNPSNFIAVVRNVKCGSCGLCKRRLSVRIKTKALMIISDKDLFAILWADKS